MTKRLNLAWPVPSREIRSDSEGDGHFGARRTGRIHRGIDIVARPGTEVRAPCDGNRLRIGTCYGNDPEFNLIEIVHDMQATIRMLYVIPHELVRDGQHVSRGDLLGHMDDLHRRYKPAMVNHCHFDVALWRLHAHDGWGCVVSEEEETFVNPLLFLED